MNFSKNKVIFVDWHKVLSVDRFWQSILHNKAHPYSAQLELVLHNLFHTENDLLQLWLKGEINYTQAILELQIDKIGNEELEYWTQLLLEDCSKMRLNLPLVSLLRTLKPAAFIVLATDNMDCFLESASKREDLAFFDDILCSSQLKCLKEDAHLFYGKWLSERSLNFEDALLLDDRTDNCEAFIRRGGEAIQIDFHSALPVEKLNSWVFSRTLKVTIE